LTEKEQAQKYVKVTPYQLLWKLIVVYYGNKLWYFITNCCFPN